jgi:hypothetical protein
MLVIPEECVGTAAVERSVQLQWLDLVLINELIKLQSEGRCFCCQQYQARNKFYSSNQNWMLFNGHGGGETRSKFARGEVPNLHVYLFVWYLRTLSSFS